MSTATDQNISEIIEQARSGDTGAFARIVRQYQGLVSGVLFSATGDFHKSEDLTQETFLIAWKKLDELRDAQNLAAWLCTIARNLAHRSYRNKVVNTTHGSLENEATSQPGPDAELLRREQSEMVWSAIGEIDEKYRETLVLYYRSGKSIREIAAVTESTEDAVKQRLVRARKSLKVKLEQMIGDVLTETAPGELFTLAVMTTLGAAMVSNTAQAAVAATTGAAAGTGSVATGKTLGFATLCSVLAPVVFYTWLFTTIFRMTWLNVRNAPTLRARRFRIDSVFQAAAYLYPCSLGIGIFWMAVSLFVSSFLFSDFSIAASFFVSGPMLVSVLLIELKRMNHRNRIYRTIIENDLGISELPSVVPSYRDIEHRLYLAIVVNTLLTETLLGLVLLLPLTDASAPWYYFGIILGIAVVAGLFLYGYYRFGRLLLEMGRTPETFLATPPRNEKPFEAALRGLTANPEKFDWKTKSGTAYGVWYWIGFGSLFFWGASWLNWNDHPFGMAFCLVALVLGWNLNGIYAKRISQKKRLFFLGAGIFAFTALISTALVMLHCNTTSVYVVWQSATGNSKDFVVVTLLSYIVIALFGFVVQSIYGFITPGDERLYLFPEKFECDARLQEAVDRYVPREMDDSVDNEPTRFPEKWIKVFVGYGLAILTIFMIGMLLH